MDVSAVSSTGPWPLDELAVEIDHHEIAGLHFRPVQPEGREQKSIRMARHEQGEVIVDPLVQAKMRRQAVTGGEIDSRLALRLRRLCADLRLAFMGPLTSFR